jgi:uncharacterized membrane-anchored protein YhcB (DUF1043 family)
MRNINLYLACLVAVSIVVAISCTSPVQKAEQDVIKANAALEQAKLDSISDYQEFRKESEERMARNAEMIESYKQGMKSGKRKIKEQDRRMMAELEETNEMMKMKLNSFKSESKEEWDTFKKEYTHDMDNLGTAITNFTVHNTK